MFGPNVSTLLTCLQGDLKSEDFKETAIIEQKDIVKIEALNVDFDYATISKSVFLLYVIRLR